MESSDDRTGVTVEDVKTRLPSVPEATISNLILTTDIPEDATDPAGVIAEEYHLRREPHVLALCCVPDQAQVFEKELSALPVRYPQESEGSVIPMRLKMISFTKALPYFAHPERYESFYQEVVVPLHLNVVCVLTTSDGVVPLTDWLVRRMALQPSLSNAYDTADLRRDKYLMQHQLQLAGVEHARSAIAQNYDEALRVVAEKGMSFPLVVKPVTGAGNEFVSLCENPSELQAACTIGANLETTQGTILQSVCVQEYLRGVEYVANTVSCCGRHVFSDVWRSRKDPTTVVSHRMRRSVAQDLKRSGIDPPQFSSTVFVYNDLDLQHDCMDSDVAAVCDYTEKVLDALGVAQGAAHCEVMMVPQRGPVLIELNARVQGDIPRATAIMATDQYALSAYIAAFFTKIKEGTVSFPPRDVPSRYRIPASPTIKVVFFISHAAGIVTPRGQRYIRTLRTFKKYLRSTTLEREPKEGYVHCCEHTVDLYSCIGAVLLGGSPEDCEDDYRIIRRMEELRLENFIPPPADEEVEEGGRAYVDDISRSLGVPQLFISLPVFQWLAGRGLLQGFL